MLNEAIQNLDAASLVSSLLVLACLVVLGIMAYTARDQGYRSGFYDGFKQAKGGTEPAEDEAETEVAEEAEEPVAPKKVSQPARRNRVTKPRQSIAEQLKRKARSSR